MEYGSLPHSIVRSLPLGSVEPDHAPDGLTEAAVDALIAETGLDLGPEPEASETHPLGSVIQLRPAEEQSLPFGDEAA